MQRVDVRAQQRQEGGVMHQRCSIHGRHDGHCTVCCVTELARLREQLWVARDAISAALDQAQIPPIAKLLRNALATIDSGTGRKAKG
jgi:hypothetical protein